MISLFFSKQVFSAELGNNWTKHCVQETQPITNKTAYSFVAVTLMPDFFWCSPIFHPKYLFLAPTPPLLGLLLALREAAWFHSGTPFNHNDFLLPPSYHISLLHKVTNRQLVIVSMSKNLGLFFRGWGFFSEGKQSIWSMAEGRGGPILKFRKG